MKLAGHLEHVQVKLFCNKISNLNPEFSRIDWFLWYNYVHSTRRHSTPLQSTLDVHVFVQAQVFTNDLIWIIYSPIVSSTNKIIIYTLILVEKL